MVLYAFITELNTVIMSPFVTTFPKNSALLTAMISTPLIQKCLSHCSSINNLWSQELTFFAVTFVTLQRTDYTTLYTHVAPSQFQKVGCCAMDHHSEIRNCPSSCKTTQMSSITTLFTKYIQPQLWIESGNLLIIYYPMQQWIGNLFVQQCSVIWYIFKQLSMGDTWLCIYPNGIPVSPCFIPCQVYCS